MRSVFEMNGSGCLICNNGVMTELGKLQGVFGAEVDFLNKRVIVDHTDEVTQNTLLEKLHELGFL